MSRSNPSTRNYKIIITDHTPAGFDAGEEQQDQSYRDQRRLHKRGLTYISLSSSAMTSTRFLNQDNVSGMILIDSGSGNSQFNSMIEAISRKVIRILIQRLAIQNLVTAMRTRISTVAHVEERNHPDSDNACLEGEYN